MILRPLSSLLYGDTELEGGDLDWRQGFIAAYSKSPTTAKPRQRLVPHTDDAEVSTSQYLKQFKISHLLTKSFTHMLCLCHFMLHCRNKVTLNLCLGKQFEGGNVRFWGIRGHHSAGKLLGEYKPEIGRAVIHCGRHFHEVTDVVSGDRYSLIQWARSWGGCRKHICPCCWLNRRSLDGKDACVCGKSWN